MQSRRFPVPTSCSIPLAAGFHAVNTLLFSNLVVIRSLFDGCLKYCKNFNIPWCQNKKVFYLFQYSIKFCLTKKFDSTGHQNIKRKVENVKYRARIFATFTTGNN